MAPRRSSSDRRSWLRLGLRGAIWGAVALMILAVAVVGFLTRTGPGVSFFVDQLLPRLEGSIAGSVTVDEATSADLLEGVTLRGIRIRDGEGEDLLRVDSLSARYSAFALLRGDVVLDHVQVWGPWLRVERRAVGQRTNVERVFLPEEGSAGGGENGEGPVEERRIVLRDVELARGELIVALASEEAPPEGAFVEPPPEGGGNPLRRYRFSEVEGSLPRVSVVSPRHEGIEATVSRLLFTGEILREPVRLEGMRGRVRVVGPEVVLENADLRLPGSRISGNLRVGWADDELRVRAEARGDSVDLDDARWLAPDLPAGRASGAVEVAFSPDTARWRVEGGALETGGSRVEVSGVLYTRPGWAVRDVELRGEPVELSSLERWLPADVPLEGRVEGTARLDGDAGGLRVESDLTLFEEGVDPVGSRLSGVVALAEEEVRELRIELDPLDYRLLDRFAPQVDVGGTGSVRIEGDGSLARGLRFDADLRHRIPGSPRSRVGVAGTLRMDSVDLHLDLDGELDPFSLATLSPLGPRFRRSGTVEGTVRLQGRVGDLRVETDLTTEVGRIALDARLDLRDPWAGYRLDAELDGLAISELLQGIPEPAVLSGSLSARGRGRSAESLEGEAELRIGEGEVGHLRIEGGSARVRAGGGLLHVDTVEARTNLVRLGGRGRLGLTEEDPDGEFHLTFENDSLRSLEPFVFGDSVIAADTLSPLEREALRLADVDPDTLPTAASVALGGRLRGEVTLRGSLEALDGEGSVTMEELVYGTNFVERIESHLSATDVTGSQPVLDATLRSDSVQWGERAFLGGELTGRWSPPGGRGTFLVRRSATEEYRLVGSFRIDDEDRGRVDLEEVSLAFEGEGWTLEAPSVVEWTPAGIRVGDLRLVEAGGGAIRAQGVIPFQGEADFDLDVEGLNLSRLSRVAQVEDTLGGRADLRLRVSGTARSPLISGSLGVDSLRFRTLRLSRLAGTVTYQERRLRGEVTTWQDDLEIARIEGSMPLDLALAGAGDRIPRAPVELSAVMDSFPAAIAASFVEAIDEAQGTVSGEATVTGEPGRLRPSGRFRLRDGAFRIPGLGIRPRQIEGTVLLEGDGRARVELEGRSRGTLAVQGVVTLNPLSDPGLDLTMTASNFEAVNRRDLSARLGGEFTLRGRYREPLVEGAVRVQQGTLFLEEFERSAEVLDLSDPTFFDVVETETASLQPVLEESRNPFLENLRVQVDVGVESDTWLRSRDMNVEMQGELVITFDRGSGELVLVGELDAVRGTYRAFGRTFQVQGGTVEFVGTPGLDPSLDIEANTRLRTADGEPLVIVARVSGTLEEPRVNLTSGAQPAIAESDLASYLLFGRPSYALGSGESSQLRGQAGALLGAAGEMGASLLVGRLANQLGTVVQDAGLDYFSLTQDAGSVGDQGGGLSSMAGTQLEAGKYLARDLFLAVLIRPLSGLGTTSQERFGGFRAEWRITDHWQVEGFVEERFSRQRVTGFGGLAFETPKVFGFFIRREWGY